METISFREFQKMDIRIGKILSAERIEATDKLLKLEVDIGEDNNRVIVAGIGDQIKPEDIIAKEIPVLVNLEPKSFKGVESQGMILVVVDRSNDKEKYILLHPANEVPAGSKVE